MVATMMRFAGKGCAVALILAAALLAAPPRTFDGSWQMDTAKSHVSDGRVVTLAIATSDDGIKLTMTTVTTDAKEVTSEFQQA